MAHAQYNHIVGDEDGVPSTANDIDVLPAERPPLLVTTASAKSMMTA